MADTLSRNVLWHGVQSDPSSPEWLTAGPLAVGLEEGQLRGIYFSGTEIVRRIYGAVRDRFWNTVPGELRDMKVDHRNGGFRVSFTSEHVSAEVDFVWRAEVTGTADGTIRYSFDGEARREMFKNRIGLCVLLPLSFAGQPCGVEYVSGDRAEARFPQLVDPVQPVRGLHDFRELRGNVIAGVDMVIGFEGDVFEIEDQRNWTDASFKAYSTPQRIPLPAKMAAGQRVRQAVTLRISAGAGARPPATVPAEPEEVTIALGEIAGTLPALGVGAASHASPLTVRETDRLRALALSHYRVETDPSQREWETALERGLREAEAMGARAEVVLPLVDDIGTDAQAAAGMAARFPGVVARWLVLMRRSAAQGTSLQDVRDILVADGAAVGSGTDADFFQLNNNRPPAELSDFVSVPLRPCAHQFDRATLVENLAGQREVLKTMSEHWPGKPLVVSPVSFRTRVQKGRPPVPGELPARADVRQMSLFGSAWTLGCVKALAESGASSVTLFQTTGLYGILERESGSEAPAHFHSVPGGVFPVYLVMAFMSGWRGAQVIAAASDAPHVAEALALTKEGRSRVLLANYSPRTRRVALTKGGEAMFVRADVVVLEASNALAGMANPEAWLADPPRREMKNGIVELPPFAIARVDLQK